jgi:hypothetical protein
MEARFLVERTYLLPSRSLFVLEGSIAEGNVQPGMNLLIGFNRSFSMACEIEGVEFVRRSNTERVALTVRYDEADEGEFLQSFNISNEEVLVSNADA